MGAHVPARVEDPWADGAPRNWGRAPQECGDLLSPPPRTLPRSLLSCQQRWGPHSSRSQDRPPGAATTQLPLDVQVTATATSVTPGIRPLKDTHAWSGGSSPRLTSRCLGDGLGSRFPITERRWGGTNRGDLCVRQSLIQLPVLLISALLCSFKSALGPNTVSSFPVTAPAGTLHFRALPLEPVPRCSR